jgi:hypothetical protein
MVPLYQDAQLQSNSIDKEQRQLFHIVIIQLVQ